MTLQKIDIKMTTFEKGVKHLKMLTFPTSATTNYFSKLMKIVEVFEKPQNGCDEYNSNFYK